jgi:hypothetical protein
MELFTRILRTNIVCQDGSHAPTVGPPTSIHGPHISRRTHSAHLDTRWGPPSSSIGTGRPVSAPRNPARPASAAQHHTTLYAQVCVSVCLEF